MTKPIFIVYHVAVLGIWEQIVREQLDLLQSTGLGIESEKIFVQITGVANSAQFQNVKYLFEGYSFSHKIQFRYYKTLDFFEFPSIKQVQNLAKRYLNAKILYFHTKGVSHGLQNTKTENGRWNAQQVANLKQWRKFMEYFTIEKWQDCLAVLEHYDCCGTDWLEAGREKAKHFSGNFWWANASYINRCHLNEGSRFNCEFFIGTGNPNAKQLMSSILNPSLNQYFSPQEIKKMSYSIGLTPPFAYFSWWDFYYDEKYYRSENHIAGGSLGTSSMVYKNPQNIQIVYHVGVIGAWREIVEEQLELLEKSGLGESSERIFVTIAGLSEVSGHELIDAIFKKHSFFSKMTFEYHESITCYEFPSIRKIQEIAQRNPQAKICYFHTKGASYPLKFTNPNHLENVKQWRKVMEYFNIMKWKKCYEALEAVDACGIEWGKTEPQKPSIFAGNFWWANGSYVNRCQLNTRDRYDCEEFIGTGHPKVKNFFSSGKNPRLKHYFTDEEIEKMAPDHAFFNLKMFDYRLYYLDKVYYMDREDL